jgi:hypothetical protein
VLYFILISVFLRIPGLGSPTHIFEILETKYLGKKYYNWIKFLSVPVQKLKIVQICKICGYNKKTNYNPSPLFLLLVDPDKHPGSETLTYTDNRVYYSI